jgi:heme/copper-type cytochrome/quinol oxidase subunit 2
MAIAVPSFALLFSIEVHPKDATWVKIIGAQWYWIYEYYTPKASYSSKDEYPFELVSMMSIMEQPDSLIPGDSRLLEVDSWLTTEAKLPLRIFITSQDVIHSWAVPSFGVKIDALPGRLNMVSVTPKREGIFYGQCSELCGVNHAFMPILVEVRPSSEVAA